LTRKSENLFLFDFDIIFVLFVRILSEKGHRGSIILIIRKTRSIQTQILNMFLRFELFEQYIFNIFDSIF